jgi:hypothetical protein
MDGNTSLSLLEDFYGPGGRAKPICEVYVYIQNYVLSQSPGLDPTTLACP